MKTDRSQNPRRRPRPNGEFVRPVNTDNSTNWVTTRPREYSEDTMMAKTAVRHRSISPAWVQQCSQIAPDWKRALAQYAATHLIDYGDVIQIGSGTTFNALMSKIIERQLAFRYGLDLVILTSNLQIVAQGRDAQNTNQGIFGATQIILTGGALQMSLDSLIGQFAAESVKTGLIDPRTTFFGASGLSFRGGGMAIRYQFEEELSTQVAYATRPTNRRVLLCDHTKFGKNTGWKAELTLESLMVGTSTCLVVSTFPDGDSEDAVRYRQVIEQEEYDLRILLRRLLEGNERHLYMEKEFALRLVDLDGHVIRQVALSDVRNELSLRSTHVSDFKQE